MRILTLGKLFAELKRWDKTNEVRFDFCDQVPTELRSYRGDYSQLALGHKPYPSDLAFEPPVVADLLTALLSALEEPFDGYKGGVYRMSQETPIWVDNWGKYTSTKIVGVAQQYSTVYLLTEKDLT